MLSFVQFMGGIEQCFGRNAANIKTSTSKSSSLLNADSLESSLSSLDSGDVSFKHKKADEYLLDLLR